MKVDVIFVEDTVINKSIVMKDCNENMEEGQYLRRGDEVIQEEEENQLEV